MRSNSALAVAAVVSVAFGFIMQPAAAAPILIDTFGGTVTTGSSRNGSESGGATISVMFLNQTPTSDAFDQRTSQMIFEDLSDSASVFSGTVAISGGIGEFIYQNTAVPVGEASSSIQQMRSSITWRNVDGSSRNFLGDGVGGFNDRVRAVVTAVNVSTPVTTSRFSVTDSSNRSLAFSFAPIPSVGTLEIPFSSFLQIVGSGFDWSQVKSITYFSRLDRDYPDTALALSNSIAFDSIAVVPEPVHMTLVAGLSSAAFGAWRLRRRSSGRLGTGAPVC
jgi:hypothetical protein